MFVKRRVQGCRWLQAPASTFPEVSGTHESWNKNEQKEYEQDEHDARSKEREQDDNHHQYILYQAQYSIEKTGGSEGGN